MQPINYPRNQCSPSEVLFTSLHLERPAICHAVRCYLGSLKCSRVNEREGALLFSYERAANAVMEELGYRRVIASHLLFPDNAGNSI